MMSGDIGQHSSATGITATPVGPLPMAAKTGLRN